MDKQTSRTIIVVVAILAVAYLLVQFKTGSPLGSDPTGIQPQAAPTAPRPTSRTAPITDMKALADDDPFLGEKNAPVTMIEFSDYQCPFCRRFYTQTLPQIKSEYIDTGKVKFVYRDFPLSFHPGAQPAAEAAECARKQGGDEIYFKFHDVIFEEQGKLGQGTVQFGATELKQWAKNVPGLDYSTWETCLDSGEMKAEVQKDFQEGGAAGITGTPGFVINGKLVSGAQPFSAFKVIIDGELGQ